MSVPIKNGGSFHSYVAVYQRVPWMLLHHGVVRLPGSAHRHSGWRWRFSTPKKKEPIAMFPLKLRKKKNTHPVYMPSHENLGSHRFPIWIWITKNNPWSTTKVYAQATASSVAAGPRMVGPAPGEGEKNWEKKPLEKPNKWEDGGWTGGWGWW